MTEPSRIAAAVDRVHMLVGVLVQLRCRQPNRLPSLCAHIATMPNTAALVMVTLASHATRDIRGVASTAPGAVLASLHAVDDDGKELDIDALPPDVAACGRMLAAMSVGDVDTAMALATVAAGRFGDRVPEMLANLTGHAHDAIHSG